MGLRILRSPQVKLSKMRRTSVSRTKASLELCQKNQIGAPGRGLRALAIVGVPGLRRALCNLCAPGDQMIVHSRRAPGPCPNPSGWPPVPTTSHSYP